MKVYEIKRNVMKVKLSSSALPCGRGALQSWQHTKRRLWGLRMISGDIKWEPAFTHSAWGYSRLLGDPSCWRFPCPSPLAFLMVFNSPLLSFTLQEFNPLPPSPRGVNHRRLQQENKYYTSYEEQQLRNATRRRHPDGPQAGVLDPSSWPRLRGGGGTHLHTQACDKWVADIPPPPQVRLLTLIYSSVTQ